MKKRAPVQNRGSREPAKKASQSSRPQTRRRSNPFFGATCACRKILCAEGTCSPQASALSGAFPFNREPNEVGLG